MVTVMRRNEAEQRVHDHSIVEDTPRRGGCPHVVREDY